MARPKDMMHETAASSTTRSTKARKGSLTLYVWLVSLLSTALFGCSALPKDRVQRALYMDAQKALLGEHRLGWTVDRVELEQATAQTEQSACLVTETDRRALRSWVGQRIAAEGGPAKEQYARGVDVNDLDEVIELEHLAAVLDQVEEHVPEDCPFWVKPDPKYKGIHSTSNRFVLIAESMGSGALLLSHKQVRLGGGGQARLFLSYGFSRHLQIAIGVEAGGDAILQKQGKTLSPVGAFEFGAPTFIRWNDLDRIYDLELSPISRLTNGKLNPLGGRIALAGGVNGLRRLGFMPAIQIWVGYEIYPEQNGLAAQHLLRLGTRVAIDYDP